MIGVLDLDTTMVGQWWWDFGDLVRSVAHTQTDSIDQSLFAAAAAGFFDSWGELDAQTRRLACVAPSYMAYMLCVRFLSDHFAGDRYFLVDYRGENLQRALRQFRALRDLESDAVAGAMSRSLARLRKG